METKNYRRTRVGNRLESPSSAAVSRLLRVMFPEKTASYQRERFRPFAKLLKGIASWRRMLKILWLLI